MKSCMRKSMRKIGCVLTAAVMLCAVPQDIAQAGTRNVDVSGQTDEVVLTVAVGSDEGELDMTNLSHCRTAEAAPDRRPLP